MTRRVQDASTINTMGTLAGFRGIFVVSFAVFFLIALVAQLCLVDWRSLLPGAEGSRTLLGGVKSAVYTFMSHLS